MPRALLDRVSPSERARGVAFTGARVTIGNLTPTVDGQTLALTHGAYSRLVISERAGQTADELRPVMPVANAADEVMLQALAFAHEQLKAAATALEEPGLSRTMRLRLSEDARAWLRTVKECCSRLGLTPQARATLRLTMAQGGASFDLERLSADERATFERLFAKVRVSS